MILVGKPRLVAIATAVVTAAILPLTITGGQSRASDSTIPPYTVVFSHGNTTLGQNTIGVGSGLDVVWKSLACSNGYGSPPVAMTWSGPTDAGGDTPAAAAPLLAPCHKTKSAIVRHLANGPDDVYCQFSADYPWVRCKWTWNSRGSVDAGTSAISNPFHAANGNVFLNSRTLTAAYLIKNGASSGTKFDVPKKTNAVHWYGPQGG